MTLSQPERPYTPGTRLTLTCRCGDGPPHGRGISRCVDRDVPLDLTRAEDGGAVFVVLAEEGDAS